MIYYVKKLDCQFWNMSSQIKELIQAVKELRTLSDGSIIDTSRIYCLESIEKDIFAGFTESTKRINLLSLQYSHELFYSIAVDIAFIVFIFITIISLDVSTSMFPLIFLLAFIESILIYVGFTYRTIKAMQTELKYLNDLICLTSVYKTFAQNEVKKRKEKSL